MNKKKYRKLITEIKFRDQKLYDRRISAEIRKIDAEIKMVKINRDIIKEEMKNIYRECILEVKKEKEVK